ncbi:MAG: hypothetical protein JST92_16435, partial [Deltaproteobacteria bacterium]|nr:hypothetical protein [Deltaproteobacteria bacterium]
MGPLASLKARLGGLPRAVLLHLLLVVLVPVAVAFAPLADHLSYEFAELMALVFGSTGGAVGLLVGRRSLLAGSSLPAPGLRGLSPARAASFPALRVTLGSLAVPVALILLNGLRRPVCDPLAGLAMYVVLVVPSALLSLALGRLCALLWPRRAGLLYALVALVSLADTLAPVLAGPQVFAHNHLLGLYPGPIYDEAIALTPAILRFRLITLALALVCALVPWVRPLWRERGFGLWPRLLAAKIVLVALAALLGAHLVSKPLRPTIADLDEALGGRIETAHLILHFPREKSGLERTLMVRDAEASVTAVLEFFALPAGPLHKVDVFLYHSAEEKQRLIGAADTSFAKPWLHEVHTNDAPAPHPVLRHELVHAFGAEVSHTPFGVPGRLGGLVPDMAFIEGLAVAGDFPWGEGTIHEETAAMRAQGRLPDLVQLFSPGRFYGESGARAYTAAGSLLRFLWETRGPAALARAYASPQGIAVLGPLDQLVAGHAKFLDTIQVPPNVASNASLRFAAPAIVHKRCPHEVADLERRAAQAANRGDSEAALALFEQCVALEPDDP